MVDIKFFFFFKFQYQPLKTVAYNAIPIALDLNPNKTNMAH